MKTGPIFNFNNSVSQKLFCHLANVGSKFCWQGGWNSWLHHIPIANKSTGRTAREPVNVYLPGEEIPSPRKRNRVKSIKITSDTTGNYPLQGYQNGAESEFNKSTSNPNFVKIPFATQSFHESMTEAANVRERKFICLEGQRLVEEGFKAGLEIHKLFLRKTIKEVPSRLAKFVEQLNISVYRVNDTAIKNWSALTTPPGIVGIFRKPMEEITRKNLKKGMPVTVICDNVREPGNLGSILRSAAGAGCESVLLSKADIQHPLLLE
ncbi:unnamed protein product [Allacma fusca]|uniref:RNA 2-O ribose methyltransferase substrate binding domain-containing protein n=1 Tax=Allacma fusca TaxID=39272 RepID=A0A8J2JDX5_9HEXA|nr:unnamed protein product [Allacma fusca]